MIKASFATSEEMIELAGMEAGGVTPFALPADLPIYVNGPVRQLEWVILGGGGRDIKLKVAPVVFAKIGAEVILDLALAPYS